MENTEQKPSIYLVLNCSEENLQVVFGTPGQVLWTTDVFAPGRAMKHIATGIRAGLDSLEIQPGDLSGITCVQGPGSFTGIRMVFAHAQGMAMGARIPMSKICGFDALISGPGPLLHGPAWIFIHSRRNQVYARGYLLPSLQPLSPAACMSLENITELVKPRPGQAVNVLGSGVRRNPKYFTSDIWNILPRIWDIPLPQVLLDLSTESSFASEPLFPGYLRLSDAEEKLANSY